MGRRLGYKSMFIKKIQRVLYGISLALLLISVGCSNTFLDVVKDKVAEESAGMASYTITFDKNDASATGSMADQTVSSGSTVNLTPCGFTKAGWTFTG